MQIRQPVGCFTLSAIVNVEQQPEGPVPNFSESGPGWCRSGVCEMWDGDVIRY